MSIIETDFLSKEHLSPLMTSKNPLENLLNLALKMSQKHYEFYDKTANSAEVPQVKALLRVLADTEYDLIFEIQHMIATGVLDEIEAMGKVDVSDIPPDDTPFAPERNDTDPRIFVCNKALEQEIKGYTFYLSLATRAKSELVSRVFEYLAFIKSQQIDKIRKVCGTF
ncbi:hypothetical protein EU527_15625 [Candidatus Thorarchaeota archaeon]|nr:MAG: hypothetical protein EU527_15625 [Candidatus Thorarchaeota archaeon]